MAYEKVEQPIAGPDAFRAAGDNARLSQAAILLLLGTQLRGDDYALEGRAAAADLQPSVEALPREDLDRFPVPRVKTGGRRVGVEHVRFFLADRYGAPFALAESREEAPPSPTPLPEGAAAELAQRVYENPEPLVVAQLLELHLSHPDPLLRVAAASTYFDLSADPIRLIPVLAEGTQSEEELVRDVAATALARVAPDHPRLAALTQSAPTGAGGPPTQTSLLVHGTFARASLWWQPGGDFHAYLRANVRPDLYAAADRFEWSGGYSDQARALGADDLGRWLRDHNLNRPDLFAHSHGGSVAMLTSHQFGVNMNELVLLSCPVHVQQYMPDFNSIAKVVSIRVHFDLVILADRGGQKFSHPQIQENVLPLWFDHSATHSSDIWQTYHVDRML